MSLVIPAPEIPTLAVSGGGRFPVRRVFCVGRNYAAHAREMGGDPSREPPMFFTKPADAAWSVEGEGEMPFPVRTGDLHHEVELAVALRAGGSDLDAGEVTGMIFGYGVALDLTRRDLQRVAKERRRPWDMAKGFDLSAPVGLLHPADQIGHPSAGRIWLEVDGELRQEGDLADQIWSVPELLAELSNYVTLRAGDLVLTGTPSGVGPIPEGGRVRAGILGVGELSLRVG